MKHETPGQMGVRAGGVEPPRVAPPGPKLPTRCAGRSSPGLYQAVELRGRRGVVPPCTRSSRGVAARPVSNLVSIGVPVPSGRGRLRRSGPPRPGTGSAGRARQGRSRPEPASSSVSGTAGRWRRPALSGRMWLVNWQEAGPLVTVVVRCNPVVRGPDVAPMWPQRSRAWKARPVRSSRPDATPMAQVRAALDEPLLTVRDRQLPMLRARGGHGRRGRTWLRRGGDGHQLGRRVGFVLGDHLPRWQGPKEPCGR